MSPPHRRAIPFSLARQYAEGQREINAQGAAAVVAAIRSVQDRVDGGEEGVPDEFSWSLDAEVGASGIEPVWDDDVTRGVF